MTTETQYQTTTPLPWPFRKIERMKVPSSASAIRSRLIKEYVPVTRGNGQLAHVEIPYDLFRELGRFLDMMS